jgi:hypothetical protein
MQNRRITLFAVVAVALSVGGCGGMPKNAGEFREFTAKREKVLGPIAVSRESFEVARPFRDVSSTLEKKANECLKMAVRWTVRSGLSTRSGIDVYKPTFVGGASKAELHVQLKRSGVVEVGAPSDGAYRVVLDATSVTAQRTRIEIYTNSVDDRLLQRTLHGWATGERMGCPDLTKK